VYRYIVVIYPNRLVWQSRRSQLLLIVISWLYGFIHPLVFMFTGDIIYSVDNQTCQFRLHLFFSIVYATLGAYVVPVSLIMLVYFNLIRYVKEISKRVISVATLSRAQRELQMVQRVVIIVMILLTIGFPYTIFVLMSFFTDPPTYDSRIAFVFGDLVWILVAIALLQFTDALKTSIMKRIKRCSNTVVSAIP
jgi:hypothetical protein